MADTGARQRRLQAPRITEVSGVDRPAHMHDGFFMKKDLGAEQTTALLDALGRGARMPKTVDAATASTLLKALTPEQRSQLLEDGTRSELAKALSTDDQFKKAAGGDFQPLLDQLAQVWQNLRDLSEKEDPDVPSQDGAIDPTTGQPAVTPAAPDAAAVLASPALAKSLGAEGVAMLKAMHEQSERDREDLRKEREGRADERAIAEFAKSYDGLGLDADVMGPALRKFAAAEPAAAEAIRAALTKARTEKSGAQMLLTKEFGRIAAPETGGAEDQAQTMAKSLVASGEAKTIEQGLLLAYQRQPELYNATR